MTQYLNQDKHYIFSEGRLMKKFLCAIIICVLLLLTVSCGQANKVTDVVFSTDAVTVKAEETVSLSYEVFPTDSNSAKLEWKSIDTSIATVDSTGIVSGISPGQTTISVSYDGTLLATCSVTVDKKSAYKQLTDREKDFVDAFLKYIDNVQDPLTLKISAIQWCEEDGRVWKFTAAVSGGAARNYYLYDNEGWNIIGFSPMGSNPAIYGYVVADNSYNITMVNEAIQEKIQ